MRKYIAAIALLAIFLVVFIPFASRSPDGLEKVAENLGVDEHVPTWKGLMSDYSVAAVSNTYVSTLIAGILGTIIVLLTSIVLGKAVLMKKGTAISESKKD